MTKKGTSPFHKQDEELLYRGASISDLLQAIGSGLKAIDVLGLEGSSKHFLLSQVLKEIPRPLLILTPTLDQAQGCVNDLLFFLGHKGEFGPVYLFPPDDVPPFKPISLHRDITYSRLEAIYGALTSKPPIAIVATTSGILRKTIPKETLSSFAEYIVVGEEVDKDSLIDKLVTSGYIKTYLVEGRGEFGTRGGIIDIFPPLYKNPVRIELYGDFVESIRIFDPITQRSLETLKELTIIPAQEIIFHEESLSYATSMIQRRAEEISYPQEGLQRIIDEVSQIQSFPGIEWLLPYFYPNLNTLFDYLPQDTLLAIIDPAQGDLEMQVFEAKMKEAHEKALMDREFCVPLTDLYLSSETLSNCLNKFQALYFRQIELYGKDLSKATLPYNIQINEDIRNEVKDREAQEGVLAPLSSRIKEWLSQKIDVILVCHGDEQAKRLKALFKEHGINSYIYPTPLKKEMGGVGLLRFYVGNLSSGFKFFREALIVITEDEIFGEKKTKYRITKRPRRPYVSSFEDLKENDFVVHIDYGIGRYLGLIKLTIDGIQNDFLLMEYRDGDKLYLPVDRMNVVQKYIGVEGYIPSLDKLGGHSWENTKKRVSKSIEAMAKDLLELYALREISKGHAFSRPDSYYKEFEASFEYQETPDQIAAIEDVLSDVGSIRPTDRLICGDVGYGKTEVAMRAAFIAVMDGKQVAILVPTTVLAEQHFETLSRRFHGYPVNIRALSRFKTKGEQREILEGLKESKVDIVIGTHRLLQKDVVFKDLGLLVVDEEQRFGVAHKERIKKLKASVDVIALSATPIPRTLHMSLSGIRDLSIIETPPEDRLSIRTYVCKFDDDIIRDAVLREIKRGGQVFFVHNKVQSIRPVAYYLKRLLPNVRIGIAHGQLPERELEDTMLSFLRKEIDVLATTAIIESGLDIPSVNTIIINRAHEFGLAQMYQLRGRVGRAKEQAYAYLLIPGEHLLSQEAKKRLKVLMEYTELGAGFKIALHDLQIRGGGNILGPAQSGHVASVGYEMYLQLMEEAIQKLKGETKEEEIEPELNLNISAYIPEAYISDIHQRLTAYKKLSSASSDAEIEDIREELRDRYGEIPLEAHQLMEVISLKQLLKKLGIRRVDVQDGCAIFTFSEGNVISPGKIVDIVSKDRERCKFTPDQRLYVKITGIEDLKKVLQELIRGGK